MGLLTRFPSILSGLCTGFIVGYPTLSHVQTLPNSTSLAVYESEFDIIVNKELAKKHYLGPFSFTMIHSLLGPFQSSLLLLIPKAGKLGKFHLIQNFSFPIEASSYYPSPSINKAIMADLFPCTWANFQPYIY